MRYRVYLTRRADRELRGLPPDVRERVEDGGALLRPAA